MKRSENTAEAPATIEPAEMASLMGVSVNLVYDGLRRNEIPNRRVGRRFVVARRRFLSWLENE